MAGAWRQLERMIRVEFGEVVRGQQVDGLVVMGTSLAFTRSAMEATEGEKHCLLAAL